MPKFLKRPEMVDAEQFLPGKGKVPNEVEKLGERFYLNTAEGFVDLEEGFWIVIRSDGRKRVFTPEVFDALYEKVEEPKGAINA